MPPTDSNATGLSPNLDTEVVLGPNSSAPLRDLLPYHDWPDPLPAD